MRILTVSDDAALSGRIAALLRAAGHAVDLVDSECLACSALGGGGFDLVVLDLELGDRAGPALIGRLRQGACVPPIIALAAGASAEERVLALNQGADDCVAAPIDLDEVLARVRVWMRRSLGANDHLVHHGQLTYDTMARAAYVAGEPLRLSRREASLLEVLLHRMG